MCRTESRGGRHEVGLWVIPAMAGSPSGKEEKPDVVLSDDAHTCFR